ncbi:unnamed protein product [Leptosia nina]|uniref:BHLH domain-containing protein n=1 Tax=Leptosia nina TaxID=320188 RepID=A0AAV1K1R2_9NEOP
MQVLTHRAAKPMQLGERRSSNYIHANYFVARSYRSNMRAHLRSCLEKLKDMVPLGPEASRHTTLGLLTKAKRFIKSLEEREKRHSSHKEQLSREQRYLRRRLAQLRASRDFTRSLSESSMAHAHATRADSLSSLESSSGVSTAERSPSSVSESDERRWRGRGRYTQATLYEARKVPLHASLGERCAARARGDHIRCRV